MRCPSVNLSTLALALILACTMKASCTSAEDTQMAKSADDANPQMDVSVSKRDWNRNLNSWSKRAWQKLNGGWGKRDSWDNEPLPSLSEKRAWQRLQGGWGKRFSPEDEYAARQLSAMLDQEEYDPQAADYGNDLDYDNEKRAWKALSGSGWGKRSQWGNFRGSWGKREPAWTNLKGVWGKRSLPDRTTD